MFELFKDKTSGPHTDAKAIRDAVLQEVKAQLRKAEGGEGGHIRAVQIFVHGTAEEKPVYEAALYLHEDGKLRNEVQRIADDFAIDLPEQWALEVDFVDTLPAEAKPVEGTTAALFIATQKHVVKKTATAFLLVRSGEAEQPVYTLSSESGRVNIGRERKVQTADGFYRENQVAFPQESAHASNRFVSRQHAHIEFDPENGQFCLFADEGGVPPRNKVKVRSGGNAQPVKLHSTHLGYPLQEGDQILLGDSVLLEFSYEKKE